MSAFTDRLYTQWKRQNGAGGPERSVGRGAVPHGKRSDADPGLAPVRRHVGALDAAAAVRLPLRKSVP